MERGRKVAAVRRTWGLGLALTWLCGCEVMKEQAPVGAQGPGRGTPDARFEIPLAPGLTEWASDELDPLDQDSNDPLERKPIPAGRLIPPEGVHRDSGAPAVALNARGWPLVVWSEFDGASRFLVVLGWEGAHWKRLGEGPSTMGPRNDPSSPVIAVDHSGRPVVAWTDSSGDGDRDVYVSRWTGQQWVAVGKPLSAYTGYLTSARAPSLVLDKKGNPVVAWHEFNGRTDDVFVCRWDGTSWQPVGKSLSAFEGDESAAGPTSLVLDHTGNPLVAWQEMDASASFSRIFVRSWDGDVWRPLGTPLSASEGYTAAVAPSLALAPDGTAYLAWTELEFNMPGRVHVRRWDGSSWRALAEPRGLAGAAGASQARLAVDATGVPMLAWVEQAGSANGRLHLGRWTGSEWEREPLLQEGQAPFLAMSARSGPFLAWLKRNDLDDMYSVFVLSLGASL